MIALVLAPIQFFSDVRVKYPHTHRRLGRIYVASIFVSAPIAFYIAISQMHNGERVAVAAQAALWFSTTLFAVYGAVHKKMLMHKIWIVRSYALTLSFVISRLLVDVFHFHFDAHFGGNAGFDWAMTSIVLIAADMISTT